MSYTTAEAVAAFDEPASWMRTELGWKRKRNQPNCGAAIEYSLKTEDVTYRITATSHDGKPAYEGFLVNSDFQRAVVDIHLQQVLKGSGSKTIRSIRVRNNAKFLDGIYHAVCDLAEDAYYGRV